MADDLLNILTGGKGQGSPAKSFDADAYARSEAVRQGVDPELVIRLAGRESGRDPATRPSRKGAIGYMQLMPSTAKDLGVDPNNPEQNIRGGVTYLKQQLDEFKDPKLALAAYNAGPQAVRDAGGVPNIKETRDYVSAITGEELPSADLAGMLGVTADAPAKPSANQEALIQNLTDPSGGKAQADSAQAKAQTNVAVKGGKAFAKDTGEALPEAQSKTVQTLYDGGLFDPKNGLVYGRPVVYIKPINTSDLITGATPDYPTDPGTFFVEPNGTLGMVPLDKSKPSLYRAGAGGVRGGVDIIESLGKMMPGTKGSDVGNSMEANRLVYDAMHHGDWVAGAGRFASQAVGTAPALVLGGEVLGAAGPVGEFLAGSAGKGVGIGNKLVRASSLASSGALEGAEAGALTSGSNDQGVGTNMLRGAEAGAILKPGIAGGLGAGRWAGGLARDLVDPFTTGGKERITNKVLGELAADGPRTLDTTAYVPGSEPTLAQATANPGLAAAERAVSAVRPTQFVAKGQANAEARNMAMEALRGDQQSLDDLIKARSSIADKARDAAFKNTTHADVAPVVDKIDEILASPSGQRDTVVKALTNIRKKLVEEIDLGNGQTVLHPQSDAKQLYGVRQAIADMLSPAAHNTDSNAQLAAKELGDVKSVLDKSIEAAAPGFKKYLKTFETASRPIDEQKFLQGLKLTDVNGNVTLSRVDAALESIRKAKLKPGTSDAKSVSPDTIKALQDLKADLQRAGNSSLGKGIGSNTFQNLATNNIMGRMGLPAAAGLTLHGNPIIGAAMGLGKLAYSAQNEPMLAMLENKLLDPAYGAAALNPAQAAPGMLQRLAARNALRVAATPAYLGGNRLLGAESEKPLQ